MDASERAAFNIGLDINDRRGLKWEWQQITPEIVRDDILPAWAAIIRAELAKDASGERMSDAEFDRIEPFAHPTIANKHYFQDYRTEARRSRSNELKLEEEKSALLARVAELEAWRSKAQCELERVTRDVELAFVCPDCNGTKGSMCVTPGVSEWADCSTCNGEGTMPITAIADMHKQICNLDGMYWEQRGHREDAERQLAALQQRNASLEAELAQARERERVLEARIVFIGNECDRVKELWHVEETLRCELQQRVQQLEQAQAALAGGKEGA